MLGAYAQDLGVPDPSLGSGPQRGQPGVGRGQHSAGDDEFGDDQEQKCCEQCDAELDAYIGQSAVRGLPEDLGLEEIFRPDRHDEGHESAHRSDAHAQDPPGQERQQHHDQRQQPDHSGD
ncbi:hypothetical protein [Arthrobacter ulcerisalmonis]|uniref:hypothetical protein n=1 Tax=Arthrobacter ulcerisalmonis TaxID=2483813 RepID=UPI0036278F04